MQTPLDAASKSIGQQVLVTLKNSEKTYRGKLIAIDMHLNVVLENTEELIDGEAKRQLGKCILRGDNVLFVSL
ncbi:MAG: hypothetical protein JXA43_01570 [Candidatus Diapherotrites archaeon]|nr:hypothetical protein [Candidatus Diapherotrites archaeon]